MVALDRTSLGGIWTLSGYQRELDSPNSELLILTLDRDSETLIGLACFWAILEEAHITLLAIYPDYQRQGLGKLLLYKLLEKAVQRQLERATLEVRVSNQSAIALYEHFGFRIAGERKNYYPQTGESALIFWRNDLQNGRFSGTIKQVATRNPFQTGAGRVAIRGRNQSQNRYHGDAMITYKLKSGRG